MTETMSQMNNQELKAEIVRLNKILEALMNRAERTMTFQGSDFGLFETAVRLEEEVNRRTAQLEQALRKNKEINRTLKRTQKQMETEIIERKSVEKALNKAVRRTDITARYGGEEFAVILPDAGHDIVRRVAERARKAVSDLQILHLGNNDLITISIGVSAITPSNDHTIEGFIELADAALYAAKDEGRNRVNG